MLRKIGVENVDWINVALGRKRLQAIVSMVFNLWINKRRDIS
jgi:GH24 family phage-related lysozyme (muramidase)